MFPRSLLISLEIDDIYKKWVLSLGAIYILISVLFILFDNYLIFLLPLCLSIGIMLIFKIDLTLKSIIFFTPLSIQLSYFIPDLPFDLALPSEPILLGVILVLWFKFILGTPINKKLVFHPVSMAIYFILFWLILSASFSTMPLVSIKFIIVRVLFLIGFYFLFYHVFRGRSKIVQSFWLYLIPFTIVIVYTVVRHAMFGFNHERAFYSVMSPFFIDHTSYGAALSFYLPVTFALFFVPNRGLTYKIVIVALIVLLIAALILCRTRAAWLGTGVSVILGLLMVFKVRFTYIVFGTLLALTVLLSSWDSVSGMLKLSTQDSSENFEEHLQSIFNTTTDASNIERLNRWNCAVRMFEEKPFTGWGPGTYMFQYAPFQRWEERSVISTNDGDVGNAHSEYLGLLAETGFFGLISYLILCILIINTGFSVYRRATRLFDRAIVIATTMGLFSYMVHSFLNNFLDTDKISAPFWGFAAILVVYDIVLLPKSKTLNTV